jgi:hypothetical protein
VVSLLAKSLMHGLLRAGMSNCGKHFPGHGFVKADSHTDIPVDRRSLKAILADDAAPYPWLSTTLTSVMPAHVIYPKVDRPAGFSSAGCTTSCATSWLWRRHLQRRPLAWPALGRSTAAWSATPTRRWRRWRLGVIWCCCATRAWTAARRSMPCSMAGRGPGQGRLAAPRSQRGAPSGLAALLPHVPDC